MGFYSPCGIEPERSVGYLLKRIQAATTTQLEPAFAAVDLTSIQWSSLAFLRMGRGETSAELARELGHDKGAMTRIIDVLEERGLLARRRCGDDRRVQRLALTDAGAAAADAVMTQVVAQWNTWLHDWSEDDIETLIAGLQRLRASVERPS